MSLQELDVQLNQEFYFIVTQTEPLYVQLEEQTRKYFELHEQIQMQGAKDNTPYNPCMGELCLALFGKSCLHYISTRQPVGA
jgi:hypothetical protein